MTTKKKAARKTIAGAYQAVTKLDQACAKELERLDARANGLYDRVASLEIHAAQIDEKLRFVRGASEVADSRTSYEGRYEGWVIWMTAGLGILVGVGIGFIQWGG